MVISYPRKKPIRLKGQDLRDLYYRVWERDNWTCQGDDCPGGWYLDRGPHHIKLKSQGGEDTEDNLITLCVFCHAKAHGVNLR